MNIRLRGTLLTLVAATCYGTVGPFTKLIFKYGISPSALMGVRFVLASSILWTLGLASRKIERFRLSRDQLLLMVWIGGVVYCLTTLFYSYAIFYIPVSVSLLIFYTSPAMINIYTAFVQKVSLGKTQILALLMSIGGLFFTLQVKTFSLSMLGMFLAFMAAIGLSTYFLMLGTPRIAKVDSLVTAAYTNMFSAITFVIIAGARGEFAFSLPAIGWVGVAYLSIMSTALSVVALAAGIKLIGPSRSAIISTFEPLLGVVLSILLLGESMTLIQVMGMTMILSSIILLNWPGKETSQATENLGIEKSSLRAK